ncbi:hypothetical protein KUTeg_010368 [Tegillarca granosa]|uniref:C2H2-type domain-containing protein n=1 Tax=Tegillarca granosa TaxID=220873 RepID=A0ABQ9F6H9_TEGGR|nr:hypothetical protein KUTeg_010368 [Tegillarca granosa]
MKVNIGRSLTVVIILRMENMLTINRKIVSMEMQGNISELISAAQADELQESPDFMTSSRIDPVEEVVENDEESDNIVENESANKSNKVEDILCNSSVKSGQETLQIFTVELEKLPEVKNTSKHTMQTRSSPRLSQNQPSSNPRGKKDLRYVIIKKGEIVGREIASTIDLGDTSDGNNFSSDATHQEHKMETTSKRARSVSGLKTMYCSKCNKMFRKVTYLIQHEKTCQDEQSKKLESDSHMYRQKESCGHCDYSTGVGCLMVRHKYLKHGIDFDRKKYKVFHCQYPECKFFQMTQELLTEHIKTEHLGLPSETVEEEEEEITPKDGLTSEIVVDEEVKSSETGSSIVKRWHL